MPRLNPDQRRRQLAQGCFDIACRDGLYTLSFMSVATRCGCSRGLVRHYFGSYHALRLAAILRAVEVEHVGIILQAIAASDTWVPNIPASLKGKVLAFVAEAL